MRFTVRFAKCPILCCKRRVKALLSRTSNRQRVSQENKGNPEKPSAMIGPCPAGVGVGFFFFCVWQE